MSGSFKAVKICDRVYWVGAVDWAIRDFHGYSTDRGTTYNAFRDQFGADEFLVVAAQPAEVFDLEFLANLRDLHRDLEASVPYLDDITSLINARSIRGEGDTLIVEDLMARWPEKAEIKASLEVVETEEGRRRERSIFAAT